MRFNGADRDGEGQDFNIRTWHRAVIETAIFRIIQRANFAYILLGQGARRDRHGDFMPLPDIAHIGDARFLDWRTKGAFRHHARRFVRHGGQQAIHRRDVKAAEALIERFHHLISHRRAEEANRAADARARWHQNALHADFLGHAIAMHGATATKGNHHAAFVILGTFNGMDARGIGHILINHLNHAKCCHISGKCELPTHMLGQRLARLIRIKPERTTREKLRIVAAKRKIGVGHRRVRAATPVTGGARISAGTFGAHLNAPHAVHLRDGTATRADFHHFNHRNAERQARALLEAPNARDFKSARCLRAEIINQADLGRGAAHIEGQHLIEATLPRDKRREYRTPRRAAFHQADWETRRGINGGEATTRQHQIKRASKPRFAQPQFQLLQITRHQGLHIGIGDGG